MHLLGGFRVEVEGCEVPEVAWRLRKAQHLVKLLALSPGLQLHRDQLIELLWADHEHIQSGRRTSVTTARAAGEWMQAQWNVGVATNALVHERRRNARAR